MKNTLRYIFAIPLAIIISMILPVWFMFIFNKFIPFEFITQFFENYLIKLLTGWITVGFTIIIVPKRKILFGFIQVTLNLITAIYLYKIGNNFNYLFLIGGFTGLYFSYFAVKEQAKIEEEKALIKNKELAEQIRKLKTKMPDKWAKLK